MSEVVVYATIGVAPQEPPICCYMDRSSLDSPCMFGTKPLPIVSPVCGDLIRTYRVVFEFVRKLPIAPDGAAFDCALLVPPEETYGFTDSYSNTSLLSDLSESVYSHSVVESR